MTIQGVIVLAILMTFMTVSIMFIGYIYLKVILENDKEREEK